MNSTKLAWTLLAAAALVGTGCGGDDGPSGDADGGTTDAGPVDARPDDPPGGPSYFYAINALDIARPTPEGIAAGFNLDSRVSDDTDESTCFHADFTSPPPDNEPGIDNQLGPIIDAVGGSFDVAGSVRDAIAAGDLIILVELTDVDDLTNDPLVGLSLLLAARKTCMADADCTTSWTCDTMAMECRPPVDAMMVITPGGTFDVATTSYMADGTTPLIHIDGAIVSGRFRGGPLDINLVLPVMGTELALNIRTAQVRFNPTATVLTNGVIGGALDVEETVTALVAVAPDTIPESLARSVLSAQADLEIDAEGACQSVSIGLTVSGVTAMKGMTIMPPM
jgi:hypothetical protein